MTFRVLVVLVMLGGVARAGASPEQGVLTRVNAYRAAAGLPAVVLDPALSKGCMEHAQYMKLNRNTPAMEGLAAHKQNPKLPGATPGGAACAKAADLYPGVASLEGAVDGWMAGLYHRRPVLDPEVVRVGVGYARLDDGSFMAALMFDDEAGKNAALWPVAYPAKGQADVPMTFGHEVPDPVPGGVAAGYPITLQFPAFDEVTEVKATLVNDAKKPVRFYLSDPEHPATSFGQYGVVCLIPREPLLASSTYHVTVSATWKGKPGKWSWSFTTVGLRAVDAAAEAAVGLALGVPSTVRGKVLHAGMMGDDTVFLQIGRRDFKNIKMVSVLVPIALWGKLGGKPESYIGKVVEVEGTPELVQGKYVNVEIGLRRQFRVVSEP
jgi:hypothetical protein